MTGYTDDMIHGWAVLTLGATLGMPSEVIEVENRIRLSEAWSRAAIRLVAEPDSPDAASFEGAIDLAREAAEMVPEDPDGWRVLFELAKASGDGFPEAVTAGNEAAKRLAGFKPADPVVALWMLTQAVDRQRTVEARLAAFDKALSGPFRDQRRALDGEAFDARLFFDRALLLKRAGETKRYEQAMKDAHACDPSYPPPAEALAGLASSSAVPPSELARTLVNAIAAEPTNLPSLVALARLCMHEGLYDRAEALFAIAVLVAKRDMHVDRIDELLCEQMLALWGMRQHAKANAIARDRQVEVDNAIVQQAGEAGADRGGAEMRRQGLVTLPSTLCSVHAAMAAGGQLPDSQRALRSAVASLQAERAGLEGDPKGQAALDLQRALLEVTVGDLAEVQPILDAVEKIEPLSDRAKARFTGWSKLRGNFPDAAAQDLGPIAEQDTVAKIGLGLSLQAMGRSEDAQRTLLEVLRANRSNAFGLFAADCLWRIRPEPVAASEESEGVRKALQAMPQFVWDLRTDEPKDIGCEVTLELSGGIFGRLSMQVTLQNRSGAPLAMTPTGPIETRAAVLLELTPVSQPTTFPTPFIIPIDRQLRLEPNESMSFTLDLSRSPLVEEMMPHAVSGMFVRARVYTNFRMNEDALFRGFLGTVGESQVVSMPSMKVDRGWVEDATSEVAHPDAPEEIGKLASLALALDQVAEPEDLKSAPEGGESTRRAFLVRLDPAEIERGWAAIRAGYTRLPPASQAWLLMVLPSSRLAALKPLIEEARASTDPLVRTSLMLRWIESPEDPLIGEMIDAASPATEAAKSAAEAAAAPGAGEASKAEARRLQAEASRAASLAVRARSVRALLEARARAASQLDQFSDGPSVLGGTVAPDMVLPTSR